MDASSLKHSRATRMLADAIRRIQSEKGLSLREIAFTVGYKSSVALSHFATGRAPIPLDNAIELARGLGLDPREFARAVFEQRHPELAEQALTSPVLDRELSERELVIADLESIAGCSLDEVDPRRLAIIRDVLADMDPARRWLSLDELPVATAVRLAIAGSGGSPLTQKKRQQLIDAASA